MMVSLYPAVLDSCDANVCAYERVRVRSRDKCSVEISFGGSSSDARDLYESVEAALSNHAGVFDAEVESSDAEDAETTTQRVSGSLQVREEAEPEVLATMEAQIGEYETRSQATLEFNWSTASAAPRDATGTLPDGRSVSRDPRWRCWVATSWTWR